MSEGTTNIEPQDLATVEPIEREAEREIAEIRPEQRVRSARDRAMEAIAARRQEALERELGQAERMDVERNPEAGQTREGAALDPVRGREVIEGNPAESAALDRDSNRESGHLHARPDEPAQRQAQPQGVREVEIDGHKFTVTEDQFQELARAGVRAYVGVHPVAPQHPHPQHPQQLGVTT